MIVPYGRFQRGEDVALEQVRAKGCDASYRGKDQPIYLVGLSFDSKTRHLVDTAAVAV